MGEMLPLETKQSGGKILPHSDLRGGGGVFLGEASLTTKKAGACEYGDELSIKCGEFLD